MKKSKSQEELISIIQSVKNDAEQAKPVVDNFGANIQHVIDISDVTLPIIPFLSPTDVAKLSSVWKEISVQTKQAYPWLYDSYSDSDATAGTVSLSASSISMIIERNYGPISIIKAPNSLIDDFNRVTNRTELNDKVIRLMSEFRLDQSSSKMQSAMALFLLAHHAYESPIPDSNPAVTSLIPMRESVTRAISELLILRPLQEETGKSDRNKIISIGKQLKKDVISDIVVQEWAKQWHRINDEDLSSSKQKKINRDEWRRRLNRATLFLHGFLSGLDIAKIRK